MADHLKPPNPPLKQGKRVFIRKPSPWDEVEFVKKIVSNREFHYPFVINNVNASFFKSYLLRFEGTSEGHFVCSLSNGEIMGVININDIVAGAFQSGYLGYYAFKPFNAQGFMTEGLKLIMERAFVDLNLHRLEANIQPANTVSKNFVQRLGFKKEGFSPRYLKLGGRWRDHERWAILKEDWVQLNTDGDK